jgi:hypothetical protein
VTPETALPPARDRLTVSGSAAERQERGIHIA